MRNIIKSSFRVSRNLRQASLVQYPAMINIPKQSFSVFSSRKNPTFSTSAGSTFDNVEKGEFKGPGFYVQQFLTGCLSLYSYYIESGNDAFLIDPMNETKKYEQIISERGKKLKGVFLTHYHADYIAGHLELQKKYGGEIYLGPKALSSFGIKVLKDGEEIKLGSIKLKTIHTPGHTEESSCLLLIDEKGKSQCLFTGDTVFLNEVGRPDLAVKTNLTSKDLASMLYDSLQKIKILDDDIRIYPGHGAGSSCGKNIGKGDFCNLETQKKNNYGLKETSKEAFIKAVLDQMPSPPQYFGYNVDINKFHPFDYKDAHLNAMNKISSSELASIVKEKNVVLIDTRKKEEVELNMISGAICIDFDGPFVNWVGTLIHQEANLVVFGPEERAKESIERLLRIGYKNIQGYCSDSLKEISENFQVFRPDFVKKIDITGRRILDVRKPTEWQNGIAVGDVIFLELSKLISEHTKKLSKSEKYVIHCQSGYRARIAYSLMKEMGYDVVVFGEAGYGDFGKYGIETTKGVEIK